MLLINVTMLAGIKINSSVECLEKCRQNGSKDDATNPGNNLYVTGLSTRVSEKDLEEHFAREGKVGTESQ